MTHALVSAALAAVRAKPDVRAEQVSQETLGSVLEVLERTDEWARVRGADGYEGWVSGGSLRLCSADEAESWRIPKKGEEVLVLDAAIVGDGWEPVVSLPWGARVVVEGESARLPDDRSGRLVGGQWVPESDLAGRFPADGSSVLATAREWMGVPYLWGGRTRWGADCSGFVQAVYRPHGVLLPRDSHEQASSGVAVDPADFDRIEPGDLVFFRARESERVVHVAFCLDGSAILHAAQANGQVRADDLAGGSELEKSLAERMVGVRRLFT